MKSAERSSFSDEPTDGLHLDDIRRLMKLFNKMTDQGNTLFIIEHSLDVMKDADYIVELGPGRRSGWRRDSLYRDAERNVRIFR